MKKYHIWRRTKPGKAPDVYECKMVTKNGMVKNMLMKVGMVRGTKISIASFMDITFARMAEDRLRRTESQLGVIIDNFDGMVCVTGLDYRIELVNKRFARYNGGHGKGELCYKLLYKRKTPCPWCDREKLMKGISVKKDIK